MIDIRVKQKDSVINELHDKIKLLNEEITLMNNLQQCKNDNKSSLNYQSDEAKKTAKTRKENDRC